MKTWRPGGVVVLVVAGSCTLSGCTPGIPVAYHVTADSVDVAFCESFTADRVEIDFGKYPPPFMGSLRSVHALSASGPETSFGDGVPVSVPLTGWEFSDSDASPPDEWDRVDYLFYDGDDIVGGAHFMRSDARSSEWGWTEGLGVSEPSCSVQEWSSHARIGVRIDFDAWQGGAVGAETTRPLQLPSSPRGG